MKKVKLTLREFSLQEMYMITGIDKLLPLLAPDAKLLWM
jgi:hypothetical protein